MVMHTCHFNIWEAETEGSLVKRPVWVIQQDPSQQKKKKREEKNTIPPTPNNKKTKRAFLLPGVILFLALDTLREQDPP
jgi:hypothetical protein